MPWMNDLVRILIAQSICFAVSWSFTYLLGHRLRRGHWMSSLLFLAAINLGAFRLVHLPEGGTAGLVWWIPVAVVALVTVALTEHWNLLGQASFSSTVLLSGYFLVYVVGVTAQAHLGPLSLVFALVLLALQTFALLLLATGSYEIIDVICRIRWRRVEPIAPSDARLPRVSLHVPAYNEPPDMVIETLDALAKLDYPDYEVIVVDDNTTDPGLWRPVEEHCKELGFRFFHLENWPGFKSGALNFALAQTDPEAEIVGVVDSDYIVLPIYLRACVGHFENPRVAFVQTPQDYRDVAEDDVYANACYLAYAYFFKVSMASRNEHNGIIFAGTMGLIRRNVLVELGGWDEWCITEDAEISLRILDRGHQGIYLDHSFGRGLMPLNFEGLKKQRFRWAFGGMQILRKHWGALMPWARRADSAHRLSAPQRWDYLMGGLQWLNDPATVGFTMLLLLGAGSMLVAHSLFIQPLAPAVLYVPFLFIFMGVTRFLWALRIRSGCRMGRAVSSFMLLLGLTWVVTLACILGLTRSRGLFLRTPKKRTDTDRWHHLRIVSHEMILGGVCAAAAITLAWRASGPPHVWLMVGLLFWQCLIYLSALVCSDWGYRSEARSLHPQYAQASRTTGLRFSSMVTDRPVVWGITGGVVVSLLLFGLAVNLAPEEERIFRTNPNQVPFAAASLLPTPPETQVKATLYLEKEAALHGDADAALRLWDPQGVIRDANYTVQDSTDDRVWTGVDAIRRRYVEEFRRHRYLSLAHSAASVVIEGDRAVVVNDLRAEISTPSGVQSVYLARGDRWVFERRGNRWRIVELTVNRAPR